MMDSVSNQAKQPVPEAKSSAKKTTVPEVIERRPWAPIPEGPGHFAVCVRPYQTYNVRTFASVPRFGVVWPLGALSALLYPGNASCTTLYQELQRKKIFYHHTICSGQLVVSFQVDCTGFRLSFPLQRKMVTCKFCISTFRAIIGS